jgi:hypothetical protein
MTEEITAENYKKIAKKKSRTFPSRGKYSIPEDIDERKTFSVKKTAELLDLTAATVLYHIKRKHLLAFKSSNRWLVDRKSAIALKKCLDISR